MHDSEFWQEFFQNGQPFVGRGHLPDEFHDNTERVVGNAHVWFWTMDETGVRVLLQKRALSKRNSPGKYHISAGGHINVGETPLEAAVRETYEEMGVDLTTEKLFYVGSMRLFLTSPNSILNVYLYRLDGTETFHYLDGEVDSVEWRSLENFKMITHNPDKYNLVDQDRAYFDQVIGALEYISKK